MSDKRDNLAELGGLLNDLGKRHVKVQTAWVTCQDVDWENKQMTATGVADDLPYFEVALGLGSLYRKPKPGSMCLVGMINNQDGATFLIDAEEVEEVAWKTGQTAITWNEDGLSIERAGESLTKLYKELVQALMAATYQNGAGTTGPAINLATFQQLLQRADNLLK